MIRSFAHKGLKELFTEGGTRRIDPRQISKLRLILARLHASRLPRDMDLPGLRLHPLHGDLAGFHAVNASGNWRLIFRFDGNDVFDVDLMDYH